jgi:glycogen(starch) synthase
MKLRIYSHYFWPSVGGTENTSRLLARTLVRMGHDVTVVTSTPLSGQDRELNDGYRICRSKNLALLWWYFRGADAVIIKSGVSLRAGIPAILASVPALIIWHEMRGSIECSSRSSLAFLKDYVRRAVCNRASFHVAVSLSCLQSKQLPEHARARVISNTLPDGFGNILEPPAMSARPVDVLFVGRVIESKGVLILADALSMIALKGIALRVKIVGEGAAVSELRARLSQHVQLSVIIAGLEAGVTLEASYRDSKVVVIPSIEPEGQPLVAIEALAFGLPVIASDDAALKEVVGDAGIVVPRNDASAIAVALQSLLSDTKQWEKLSRLAMNRSELFRPTKFAQSVADLLGEVKQCRCVGL